MSKFIRITLINLFISLTCFAQQTYWAVDYSYFFDNTEFAHSQFAIPQTMTGMHFTPTMNIPLDSAHKIVAGVDVLMLSGASKRIQNVMPVVYYQYETNHQKLLVGSFPRSKAISNYSDFLFSDSISYFRPYLSGIYWNVGNKNTFANIWLDWTGSQTTTDKESFLVGLSGQYSFLKNFYVDFQSYLFHLAKTKPAITEQFICDNGQAIFSVGYKNNKFAGENLLKIAAGIFGGYERERSALNNINTPVGFIAQLHFESEYAGIDAKFYKGQSRMVLYPTYDNELYWGNPFLRSETYSENKFYIRIFNKEYLQAKIGYSLHVSENKLYHQQYFLLNASIDKLIFRQKN
ncbi:MAG: hypothetical protein Q7U47_14550 [Paludibacter sp.]|nr:hypothetical protein [Paludibacter sp.]